MYKIYKIDDDLYELHSLLTEEEPMEGNRLAVMSCAIKVLGFDPKEIEDGMIDLIRNEDMDALEYGINKKFIFSYKRKGKAR